MNKYLILINCDRIYQLISPDECRDPITDCQQIMKVLIESNKDFYELDGQALGNELNKKYQLPKCPQTGCERFFGSTMLRPINLNDYTFLKLEDLELKKK